MTRLPVLVLALVGSFLATSVLGDSDFHFGGDDNSLMPGVRRRNRGRQARTPPPRIDTPIFFPGGGVGGGVVPEEPVEGVAAGKFDLPMDVNELDFDLLSRINSISNISDFASLFELDLPQFSPEAEEVGPGFSISSRFGSSSQDVAEKYEMANCKPELVTVPLDLPKVSGTMFFPTCIRLEQCGGCCYGPLLTCRPSVTKVVKVKVLKVSTSSGVSNSGRRGSGGRRRRQSQQTYHIVEAVKHTDCQCGCIVREEDCHSDLHTYKEGECACVCKNKDEESKCAQQNSTKYWDNNTCSCYCRKEVECSTGEYFAQTSCRCERLTARNGFVNPDVEGRSRRRRKPVRVPLH